MDLYFDDYWANNHNCKLTDLVCICQIQELFTDTKEELEEKTKDLEYTTKELEETSETLRTTETKLTRTTTERDEQRHLVKEHVKTETKLFGQASKVFMTFNKRHECFCMGTAWLWW